MRITNVTFAEEYTLLQSCKLTSNEMLKVSPEGALDFTRFCVLFVFTWPPWPTASQLVKRLFDICSWIFIAFPLLLTVLLCNVARYQLDDYLKFTKSICLAVSCSQAFIKMLVCKGQRSRLEMLHGHVKDFLKTATGRERAMLQHYADRCTPVHLSINVCSLAASLTMICGPLVLPQTLPTDAKYPFSVEDHPARDIAYLHQALAGLQCASIGSIDCQAALLMWFAGARLELLANEFESIKNLREFNDCVRKHQVLLEHTREMVRAVRFIILTTTIMTTLSIITGGIHIVSQEPLMVKSQFVMIDIGFIGILFVTAWPAENLINAGTAVGWGAYNSPWTKGSDKIYKNVAIVLQRSQNPIVISVSGMIPELSLTYYTSFLSKTFSFFTTLRIVIDNIES